MKCSASDFHNPSPSLPNNLFINLIRCPLIFSRTFTTPNPPNSLGSWSCSLDIRCFLWFQKKSEIKVSICLAKCSGNEIIFDKYPIALVASQFITVTLPCNVNFLLDQIFSNDLIFAVVGSQLSLETSMLPK